MSRKTIFIEKEFLNKTCEFIREYGIEEMNARSLCKYIGCSTGPLFKIFGSIDGLKAKLKQYLHDIYDTYINHFVDEKDYLYTISCAYAFFALDEPNIFKAIFMTDLAGSRTIKEVLNSSWNVETINETKIQYNLSSESAHELYRDVRFYTHGMACQLASGSIIMDKNEIKALIKNLIQKLLG